MIEGRDRTGRALLIGHRGAAALAPENTLRSFRAARDCGVDLIEFDVIALADGTLVLAHSTKLEEITHGEADGPVGASTLAQLRELAPDLPTLDEALAFFVDEAPETGLHVDLKLVQPVDQVAAAIVRHGLVTRAIVSSVSARVLCEVAAHAPGLCAGLSYPRDRMGISERPIGRVLVPIGLSSMRLALPHRLGRMLKRARAEALMLEHRLVTAPIVARAHRLGAPVVAWTVDEQTDIDRVLEAGVDAIVTNDPRIPMATLMT